METLYRHVHESNGIEGYRVMPRSPLFAGHLEAALCAANKNRAHPNALHRLLFRQSPFERRHAGRNRRCDVAVGRSLMPPWRSVPSLMRKWEAAVGAFDHSWPNPGDYAWFFHVWFLCIHPYEDGNGRTARLVWNQLRLRRGLSWHIECAANKHRYFADIERVEKEVIRPHIFSG